MLDQLTTITLVGAEAQAERQRLLADGKEVHLVCRRRDAQGGDVSRSLFFGRSGECAWVVSQALEVPGDIGIEVAFPAQAQPLFASHVERIMTAKMLTNSSPLYPELVDLNRNIDDFVADLKAEFGIDVDPWA
jgi:hypothetical protein